MKRYVIAQKLNVQSQVIARWQRIGVLPDFADIPSLQEWQRGLPLAPDGYRGETKAALYRNAIIRIPSNCRTALEILGQYEEVKQRVSAANTGREVTAEHRRKLSESGRGKRKPGQQRIPMREETKAKISASRKRSRQIEEGK